MRFLVCLLLLCATFASYAAAQVPGLLGRRTTPQFNDSRDRVDVSIVADHLAVAPGSNVTLAVIYDHEPGWHIWTNEGNAPDGMVVFDGAIRTAIAAENAADSPFTAHGAHAQWPRAHAATADIGDGPQQYAVFSDRAVAYLPVTVKPDAKPGSYTLTLLLTFQSCDDSTCERPVIDEPYTIDFTIVDSPTSVTLNTAQADTFKGFDASVFASIASGTTPTGTSPLPVRVGTGDGMQGGGQQPTADSQPASAPLRPNFFGFTLPSAEGPLGLILLAFFSMVGGFILNLTPCVLPIIPIKVLTISQHAGTPGRTFYLGLWMAIGVVAFWAALGIPAVTITAYADPSRLFGIWWLTLGIGLLIAVMGIGIMGMFTIQLPGAVYAVNPKADSAWGSFLFGIMTAVLGLPCFGFVAGSLLFGSATLPAAVIMVIFTSIGIGMAAPYLVLAAKPSLVERIPRTGPASELVKQVMGLLLLAAGAFFAGSGLIALVSDHPYLGRQLHWWVVALFAAAAGLWLIARTFQITSKPLPRLVFAIVGLVLGGAAVLYAIDTTSKARSTWLVMQHQEQAAPGTYITGIWNAFTESSFEKARADGKVVVLDFTAEWCLTCKALKAQVLNREPVKGALALDHVVAFTVDLTSNSAPGWEFQRRLSATGIPTLAIYTPGSDAPWVANAYTSDQVIAALHQAAQSKIAAR